MVKKAYAKINLAIKVISKRDDNYHNLEMVMTRINLFDKIIFLKSDNISVICEEIEEKDNLVYKIVTFLKEKYNVRKGIKIIIKKNIPSCAGLGGASSDAALVIEVLNKLWQLKMSKEKMIDVSLLFGSDIAFFLEKGPSFVSGRGEEISRICIKRKIPMLLTKPDFGIKTKDAFQNICEFSKSGELQNLIVSLEKGNIDGVSKSISNDLEKALSKKEKDEIFYIKEEMIKSGACGVAMSGSGSSVYSIYKSFFKRNKAYKKLKKRFSYLKKINNIR